jgi:ribosomal protein L24E
VVLLSPRTPSASSADTCGLCALLISPRTGFMAKMKDGTTLHTCCAHCGLLMLHNPDAAAMTLTRDFLYGRTINAAQAVYLMESTVAPCCVPSVLCFLTQDDAARFGNGFGGWLTDFAGAYAHLRAHHSHILP